MSSKKWFETWFDSPLYEQIYANRNDADAETLGLLIQQQLPVADFPRVLDLGCGRGRHSILLAQKGYRVLGLDLSDRAISIAREKASNLGLLNLKFQQGDMREALDQQFSVVINVFTTFGYFSDNQNIAVIGNIKKMLRKKGAFFMDYLNPNYVLEHLKTTDQGTFEDINYHIYRWVENNKVFKQIDFRFKDGSTQSYTEEVNLYDKNWFENAFETNGLVIEKRFGNYDGAPFDEDKSPRQVMIVKHA